MLAHYGKFVASSASAQIGRRAQQAASTVRRKQRLMIGALSVVTGLFAQMMPLILPQTPQKCCDLWKRVVLRCR